MPLADSLLPGLVDYAGLFPPAQLTMRDAVRRFAEYRGGAHRHYLGRFVVPVARLAEFETEWGQLDGAQQQGWRLSGLLGTDLRQDWAAVETWHRRQRDARIVSVELKASTPEEVSRAIESVPASIETWVELAPNSPSLSAMLKPLHAQGRGAKIRTGGVTPDAFPQAEEVVRFFRACHEASVVCKATAGLHRPLRGEYRLTYDANSPRAMMFGFVNVFLAAVIIHRGGADGDALEMLNEGEPGAFTFAPEFVRWRHWCFDADSLTAARRDLCRSFGSCSFTEPIEGLQELHWL